MDRHCRTVKQTCNGLVPMGPRLCSHGQTENELSMLVEHGVSMGPRLCSHGQHHRQGDWVCREFSEVSMGPRLCSHGQVVTGTGTVVAKKLFQWGHDFAVMDRVGQQALIDRAALGFNGATTLQSWTDFWRHPRSPPRDLFQWGHDFAVMDRRVGETFVVAKLTFQWGQDFAVMDSANGTSKGRWFLYGFNGATTLQSWTGHWIFRRHRNIRWFQWGHDFAVMDRGNE